MRVAFRVDSSLQMGTGHMMRCLVLAEALHAKGAGVAFISRELPGNVNAEVTRSGFRLSVLPAASATNPQTCLENGGTQHSHWLPVSWSKDAVETSKVLNELAPDWLVVDHYALDSRWERMVSEQVRHVMAIDDLADRTHECEVLLDQNLHVDLERRYDRLVPNTCVRFLGPECALLRPDFRRLRPSIKPREELNRLLVMMGGVDPDDITSKALEAIALFGENGMTTDVVVGAANPHRDRIYDLCQGSSKLNFFCGISNVAELMARADLAIGAGGITAWERCCLGLPTVAISVAYNQIEQLESLAQAGCVVLVGSGSSVNPNQIANAIRAMAQDVNYFRALSVACLKLNSGDRFSELVAYICSEG